MGKQLRGLATGQRGRVPAPATKMMSRRHHIGCVILLDARGPVGGRTTRIPPFDRQHDQQLLTTDGAGPAVYSRRRVKHLIVGRLRTEDLAADLTSKLGEARSKTLSWWRSSS